MFQIIIKAVLDPPARIHLEQLSALRKSKSIFVPNSIKLYSVGRRKPFATTSTPRIIFYVPLRPGFLLQCYRQPGHPLVVLAGNFFFRYRFLISLASWP